MDPGPAITVQGVATAPVIFTSGGTIVPGTYAITEAIDYTGTGGMAGPRRTIRRSMMFTATTYETARRDNDGPIETFAGTWVYGSSGGKPTWQPTDTCPGTTATTFGAIYEAKPTTIKMFVGSGVEGVAQFDHDDEEVGPHVTRQFGQTFAGLMRVFVVPLPTWPNRLPPQHQTWSSIVRAHRVPSRQQSRLPPVTRQPVGRRSDRCSCRRRAVLPRCRPSTGLLLSVEAHRCGRPLR